MSLDCNLWQAGADTRLLNTSIILYSRNVLNWVYIFIGKYVQTTRAVFFVFFQYLRTNYFSHQVTYVFLYSSILEESKHFLCTYFFLWSQCFFLKKLFYLLDKKILKITYCIKICLCAYRTARYPRKQEVGSNTTRLIWLPTLFGYQTASF